MNLSEIKKLGTLRKAYNKLLPMIQKIESRRMESPDYEMTDKEKALLFVFEGISISRERKIFKSTLQEAIDLAIKVAPFRGVTLEPLEQ